MLFLQQAKVTVHCVSSFVLNSNLTSARCLNPECLGVCYSPSVVCCRERAVVNQQAWLSGVNVEN